MNTYKIEMKFIDNEETFVMAVLSCIYEEVKLRVKEENIDWENDIRDVLDDIGRCYKTIFLYKHDPIKMLDRYDMLEMLEDATPLIKLQQEIDDLIKFFNNQITIEIVDGFPFYMDQVLPDFRNFIIFKEQ
jgi:hypothetical protein